MTQRRKHHVAFMILKGLGFTCAALASGCVNAGPNDAERGPSVITNVTIVAMDGSAPLEGKAVVIESGRIRKLIDARDVDEALGATVIDGRGGYLTPGLIDVHVHHRENIDYLNYVANGVTTVVGLGQGRSAEEFRQLRDKIAAGRFIGPRVYTTAQAIANQIKIDDPDVAREYVHRLNGEGYDLIKIYNNIPKDVFDAVVDESAKVGLCVFGHLPRNFPVEYSLSHGLDVVAHAEEFYFAYFGGPRDQELNAFDGSALPDISKAQAVIDLMAQNEVALIPNLIFSFTIMKFWEDEDATLADPELGYWHPSLRDDWRQANGARRTRIDKRMLRERIKYGFVHEFTRRAHEAGVLIATGTDAPVQGVIPGSSLHGEMRELIKTGFSFEEALAAATRSGGLLIAKYVDAQSRIGVIAPGYEADLVLVAENPLDDIRNMSRIEGVMVDGAWLERASLDRLRSELVGRYAK